MGFRHAIAFASARGPSFSGRRRPHADALDPPLRAAAELPDDLPAETTLPEPLIWLEPGRLMALPGASFVLERFPAEEGTFLIGPSLAERAWRGAHQLIAFGISTARPLAFIARARGARRWPSFYMAEAVDGRPLPERLAEDPAARRRWATMLGHTLRRLHAHGLFHAEPDANMVVCVRDELFVRATERVERRAATVPARLATLRALDGALADLLSPRARLAALRAYTRHDPPSERRSWADALRKGGGA